MLGYQQQGDRSTAALQLIDETVEVIQQALCARPICRRLGIATRPDDAVPVVQADAVVEKADLWLRQCLTTLPPAVEHVEIPGDRRAVEACQRTRELLARQHRLGHALGFDFTGEAVELAVVVHQGFGVEAQVGQVLEQQALFRRGFVQGLVTGLTAAGSQQPDGRRPAVGRGGVETIEDDVHAFEQSVVA